MAVYRFEAKKKKQASLETGIPTPFDKLFCYSVTHIFIQKNWIIIMLGNQVLLHEDRPQ